MDLKSGLSVPPVSSRLAEARTLKVIATPQTEFVAEAIVEALSFTRLEASITTKMPMQFTNDLYLVLCPQMFRVLPPSEKTIIGQMEQVRASHWVNDSYLSRIINNLAIIDYAPDNIKALAESGVPASKLHHMPIRPFCRSSARRSSRDIDVLFYGDIDCDRRKNFLRSIARCVSIRIENNLFGMHLRTVLNRTKVLVNIHFYENALLETTRLSEALTHGVSVVSESLADQTDHSYFHGLVNFVNMGDVETFTDKVVETVTNWSEPTDVPAIDGFSDMATHIFEAFYKIGILSIEEMQKAGRNLENSAIENLTKSKNNMTHGIFNMWDRFIRINGYRHSRILKRIRGPD